MPPVSSDSNVQVLRFELTEPVEHMIAWLGRGRAENFVAQDVSLEICRQTPDAAVVRIELKSEPLVETKLIPQADGQTAKIDGLNISFLIEAVVAAPNKVTWLLDVRAGYVFRHMTSVERRELLFNFDILGSRQMKT